MSATTLFRLSGLVLAFAALPGIAGHWLHPGGHDHLSSPQHPLWVPAHGLLLLSYVLSLLTLPALYARLALRGRVFGLVAFVLVMTGLLYGAMGMNVELFVTHPLAARPAFEAAAHDVLRGTLPSPLPWVQNGMWWGGTVGALLFGAFLLRSGRAWRAAGAAMVLGAPLFIGLTLAGRPGPGYASGFSLMHLGLGLAALQLWRSPAGPASGGSASAPSTTPV